MRITRGMLMKNARNTVLDRAHQERLLLCAYLSGSLLGEDFLLGGTADIDLVFVHEIEAPARREIIRLTEDIHLDIAHFHREEFNHPRQLRANAWIGTFLCKDPILLHQKQHWFEFTQASVCAHFMQPDNVLQRAHPLVNSARQSWMELSMAEGPLTPQAIFSYLKSLEHAANAVAVLSGPPLTERRFLLNFPERAEAVERPELAGGLVDLISGEAISDSLWQEWMCDWQSALALLEGLSVPPNLHPARRNYFTRAAEALFGDYPAAALWLVLRTWTRTLCSLPSDTPALENWLSTCRHLNLGEDDFSQRLNALDVYLDAVEETLDDWADDNGLVPLTEQ